MFALLYFILRVLCMCACAYGACDPESVKDDLTQCFMNNNMGTFYQFPNVDANNYRNLCYNTTCLTYCMELVAAPCISLQHMVHINNGDALTAAYLGLCDQTESVVRAFLTCGSSVLNQDVLNLISTFQLQLEQAYAASSENTTAICEQWVTLRNGLYNLTTTCADPATWDTFLNTLAYKCDSSLSPSWYASYRETSDNRCSGAGSLSQSVSLLMLAAVMLMFSWLNISY